MVRRDVVVVGVALGMAFGGTSAGVAAQDPAVGLATAGLDDQFRVGGVKTVSPAPDDTDRFVAILTEPADGHVYAGGVIATGDDHAMAVARLDAAR